MIMNSEARKLPLILWSLSALCIIFAVVVTASGLTTHGTAILLVAMAVVCAVVGLGAWKHRQAHS